MTSLDTEWEKREESTHIDKTGWYDGPWMSEPDRIEWRFAGTPRFPLLIVRGPSGALCGYVGVSEGHPFHGKKWNDIDVSAHGGITYTEPCAEGGHICHVPRSGEAPEVWWLGFDCAHSWDYSGMSTKRYEDHPDANLRSYLARPPESSWDTQYRDTWYVRREVEQLAEQCARVAKGLPAENEE